MKYKLTDFFTFILSTFDKEKLYIHMQHTTGIATFAIDNMDELSKFLPRIEYIESKTPKNQKGLSIIISEFQDTFIIQKYNNKDIKIPYKKYYHFFYYEQEIIGFTKECTFEARNFDCNTGKKLPEEPSEICCSSLQLIERFKKEFLAKTHSVNPNYINKTY